ncbi:MAG: hypothetical protein FWD17_05970 [Polyangiaceae bacterium]|nr:hypothetical protein [Polyangiaceae bacterium]
MKGPFPRLIDALSTWAARHRDEDVWVQYGAQVPPPGLDGATKVPRALLLSKLVDADVVVVHGGSGAILDAIRAGHAPVVVPRRARFGEHVNDHQLEIVDAMKDRVVPCLCPEDPTSFERAIDAARALRRTGRTYRDPLEGPLRELLGRLFEKSPRPRTRHVWSVLDALTRNVRVEHRSSLSDP